jgi:hypothetical protein
MEGFFYDFPDRISVAGLRLRSVMPRQNGRTKSLVPGLRDILSHLLDKTSGQAEIVSEKPGVAPMKSA